MRAKRKNGLFSFATEKRETYRRDVAGERRELVAAAKRQKAAAKQQKAADDKEARQWQTELQDDYAYRRGAGDKGSKRKASIESVTLESAKRVLGAAKARALAGRAYKRGYRDNPVKPVSQITDRAKRYRANHPDNRPPAPKICFACGDKRPRDIHHLNGREDDGERRNLAWACRSCNVKIANVMRRLGLGKLTRQYNPAASGAKNLGEWMNAVMSMKGEGGTMQVSDAVDMIRATSAGRRSSFAREIWDRRGRYAEARRHNPGKRCNPVAAAAELSESWHGRPANSKTGVVERIKYHGVLTDLARLHTLKILTGARKALPIVFDAQTRLASSENGRQLYVKKGDQTLDLAAIGIRGAAEKDLVTIGPVYAVIYAANKAHLGGRLELWEHAFLSETEVKEVERTGVVTEAMAKKLPTLIYDNLNGLVGFVGGRYHIDKSDFEGRYSRGIKD